MKKLLLTLLFVLLLSSPILAATTTTRDYVVHKKEAIILVGDSRVMQMTYMNSKLKTNFVFIYCNGGNIGIINHRATNQLTDALRKYRKATVIFALGVNGNSNPKRNIKRTKYYDWYIKNYPKHKFVISSVGGTGRKTGSYSNSNVRALNKLLKRKYKTNVDAVKRTTGNQKIYYFDCYKYLKDNGLINPEKSNKGTRDGLHYTNKVYRKMLRGYRKFVENLE